MYEGLLGPGCLLLHVGGGWMYRGPWVRVRVRAYHNGFFDMSSFTRGQKVMGENRRKGRNWKLKIGLTFRATEHNRNRSKTCFFSSFFSLKESVGKKIMFGMKEVTRPLVYLAFNALHEHKKILSKTTHQLPFREQPWSESVNKMKICIFLSGKWIQ